MHLSSVTSAFPRESTVPDTVGQILHGPLATIDLVRIGTNGGAGSIRSSFDLWFPSPTKDLWECESFSQALDVAKGRARQPLDDGIPEHGGPVLYPSQAIVETMRGTYLVGALATGHRGVIAPMAVDGPLVDLGVRRMTVSKPDGGRTAAVVGASRWFDLRSGESIEWRNPAFDRTGGRIGPEPVARSRPGEPALLTNAAARPNSSAS